MKAMLVSLRPTEAANAAGCPALTPELLAATGARYSRNNEGLQNIIDKIDPNHLDASVDSIFKLVDFGHQSIADMVPVSIFIDEISIWLAYYLWYNAYTASGMECSTRYIKMGLDGLVPASVLGIPEHQRSAWDAAMNTAFDCYVKALAFWGEQLNKNPSLVKFPPELANDTSDKAEKQRKRIRRNFAFDRSRYFLPSAASTNVMIVMSARGWVQLIQALMSHPLSEPQMLGTILRDELELVAPRLLKHAINTDEMEGTLHDEFRRIAAVARTEKVDELQPNATTFDALAKPFLDVLDCDHDLVIERDLIHHTNRYAPVGTVLRMIPVRFGWDAVSFGEIRDLNRHRTGQKYCPFIPVGFYGAKDQVGSIASIEAMRAYQELCKEGQELSSYARALLADERQDYVYWTLLGTQFPWMHTTTADKFIYEAELRTGTGAHYRYAGHLRTVLALWYELYPDTKGFVLEGKAEPE